MQMDHKPKVKAKTIKTCRRKQEGNLDHELNRVLENDTKIMICNKKKNLMHWTSSEFIISVLQNSPFSK